MADQNTAAIAERIEAAIYADAARAVWALESSATDWGALIDPTEYLRDDSTMGFVVGPQSLRSDRRNGDNYPIFRTEAELSIIRAVGRAMVDCTEHGQGIIGTILAYVVGCGFQWAFMPRNRANAEAITLAGVVQGEMKEFYRKEKWPCNKEDESVTRKCRDGETFLAIMDKPSGQLCLRFVEPAQVTEPAPAIAAEICARYGMEYGNWSYGIHTRDGDVEDVLGYFVQWTDDPHDYSYIPEARMVHWKANVDSNVKRGISDFYPTRNGMRRGNKLQDRLTNGASVQASIAWVQELAPGTTPAQAQNIVRATSSGTEVIPPAGNTGTGQRQFRDVSRLAANSALTVSNGHKFVPGPMGHAEKATGFVEVLAAQLRTLGVRWNMPEFLISGDASNANYASTLAASSPFGRARERDQFKFGQVQTELTMKVLTVKANRGDFKQYGVECMADLLALIEPTYTAPPVQVQDENEKLSAAQQKLQLGVNREVVMRELGYATADMVGANPAAGGADGTIPAGSPTAAAGGDGAVQDTALNGAQISSMLEIVGQTAAGGMPPESAKAMMTASFPTMDAETINGIMDPLQGFTPAVGADGKPLPAGGAAGPAANPAMASMSRLQQSRNFSSVLDILKRVASGKMDKAAGAIMLKQLALPDEDAAALLGDAADGTLDSLPAGVGESMDLRNGNIMLTVESVHAGRIPIKSGNVFLVNLLGVEQGVADLLLAEAGKGAGADAHALEAALKNWWSS